MGDQAIRRLRGRHITMVIIRKLLAQAHLIGQGCNSASRIIGNRLCLVQRVSCRNLPVVLIVSIPVNIALRVCQRRYIVVVIIRVAGGAVSRPRYRSYISYHVIGKLRRLSFRIHAFLHLVNQVIDVGVLMAHGIRHRI